MHAEKITRALEDCLEAMIILKNKKGYIKLRDLSEMLDIAPSSVVSILKRLEKLGYIRYIRREAILLTEKGERVAKEIYGKHLTIKRFLIEVLSLPEDIADEDACAIEHKIHDETIVRLRLLTDLILSDPELKEKVQSTMNSSIEEKN